MPSRSSFFGFFFFCLGSLRCERSDSEGGGTVVGETKDCVPSGPCLAVNYQKEKLTKGKRASAKKSQHKDAR